MAKRRAGTAEKRRLSTGTTTATVSAWEDDPGSGVRVTRPVPNLAAKPLAFAFPKPAPPVGMYQPGTADFRYWTAAEALRRGADFWAKRVPLSRWEVGQVLKVILDEGVDLNAYYDRKALNFFHGPSHTGTVYSGESPDIVCHEMGHAVLDSFKSQLWAAASHEAAAFHESFADMSAILSALQLPSVRNAMLTDTGGHLYHSSRLSRLAEQLGAAIRAQQPDAVDPDCSATRLIPSPIRILLICRNRPPHRSFRPSLIPFRESSPVLSSSRWREWWGRLQPTRMRPPRMNWRRWLTIWQVLWLRASRLRQWCPTGMRKLPQR